MSSTENIIIYYWFKSQFSAIVMIYFYIVSFCLGWSYSRAKWLYSVCLKTTLHKHYKTTHIFRVMDLQETNLHLRYIYPYIVHMDSNYSYEKIIFCLTKVEKINKKFKSIPFWKERKIFNEKWKMMENKKFRAMYLIDVVFIKIHFFVLFFPISFSYFNWRIIFFLASLYYPLQNKMLQENLITFSHTHRILCSFYVST